jgi:hypothetical protein
VTGGKSREKSGEKSGKKSGGKSGEKSRREELTAGHTGCDGGIDERPREEGFSVVFPLLFPARPKSRGSSIRLPRRPSRTPIGLGLLAPVFDGSGPFIMKVEKQFHVASLDKWLRIFWYSVFIYYKIISVVSV